MRTRLTARADADLDALADHVAVDDPHAAGRQVLRVLDAVESLADYPNLGRPGRVPDTRELAVGGTPYLIIYRVRSNVLWVLRVLHGARRWP